MFVTVVELGHGTKVVRRINYGVASGRWKECMLLSMPTASVNVECGLSTLASFGR